MQMDERNNAMEFESPGDGEDYGTTVPVNYAQYLHIVHKIDGGPRSRVLV